MMFILSRNNTMIYTNLETIKIKSHYKTIKLNYDEALLNILKQVILLSKSSIPVEELEKNFMDKELFLKVLKLLIKSGSIAFFYNNEMVKICQKKEWFPIFLHYLGIDQNFDKSLEKVLTSPVYVDYELDKKFPEIKLNLETLGLEISKNQDCITLTTSPDHFSEKKLLLTFNDKKLVGYSNYQPDKDSLKENVFLNKNSLLYKVAPSYVGIFVIKMILEQNRNYFVLDDSISYFEMEISPQYFYEVQPITEEIKENSRPLLNQIESLESLIQRKDVPIKISNENSLWGKAFQMGFSTIGLESLKSNFVYTSSSFENAQYYGIQKGLKFFLEDETKERWLVTSSNRYIVDKALLLLETTNEKFTIYQLSNPYLSSIKKISNYFDSFEKQFSVYVKQYSYTKSYSILIEDRMSQRIYTDNIRTIDPEDKIVELLMQLLFINLNKDFKFKTILTEISIDLPLTSQIISYIEPIDSQKFVTSATKLLQENGIQYEEVEWYLSNALLQTDIVCRKVRSFMHEK